MMHAVMLCEDVSLPSHANCKNLLGSVEVTWRGERGEDTHLCSRMFHPSLSLSLLIHIPPPLHAVTVAEQRRGVLFVLFLRLVEHSAPQISHPQRRLQRTSQVVVLQSCQLHRTQHTRHVLLAEGVTQLTSAGTQRDVEEVPRE
jgi:hypothetical protein